MAQEQFEREQRYCTVMAIVREMLAVGTISAKEYREIETTFAAKYLPVLGPYLTRIP